MRRPFGLLALTLSGLLAGGVAASAAPKEVDSGVANDCTVWNVPTAKGKALPHILDRVILVDEPTEAAGSVRAEGGWLKGMFKLGVKDGSVPIAIWDAVPGLGSERPNLFTTVTGVDIEFVPEKAIAAGIRVVSGYLESVPKVFDFEAPKAPLTCMALAYPDGSGRQVMMPVTVNIISMDFDDGLTARRWPPRKTLKADEPSLADKMAEIAKNAAKDPGKDTPKTDEPSLADKMAEITKSAKEGKDVAKADEPATITDIIKKKNAENDGANPAGGDDPGKVAAKEAEPEPKAVAKPPAICTAADFSSLPLPGNAAADAQSFTVGLRNDAEAARLLDYVATAGVTVARDFNLDVSETAGQLLVYDPVTGPSKVKIGETVADMFPVSVPGVELAGAKPIPSDAPPPEPGTVLKLMLVGAPEEVSVSGLDLVGEAFAKGTRGGAAASVEWFAVKPDGGLDKVGDFNSLGDAVAKAKEMAKADADGSLRFLVLDEGQFTAFVGNFQKAVLAHESPIDRAIWVKSAYKLPASTPETIGKLIDGVGGSDAIHRGPDGSPEPWLLVVTAKTPGFSIAYLKEPIADQRAGDVIDTDSVADKRQLIADPKGFSQTKLEPLAGLRAREAGRPPPAAEPKPSVSGTLVVDAGQIFSERGFVLSPAAVAALVERLQKVAAAWDAGGAVVPAAVKALADDVGRPSPSIIDVLQKADILAGLKLPKSGWMKKGIDLLTADEAAEARQFVAAFLKGANELEAGPVEKLKEDPGSPCTLVYVPEGNLGVPEKGFGIN